MIGKRTCHFFWLFTPLRLWHQEAKTHTSVRPMKPVGLTNPKDQVKPYAVVQLRKENKEGTLFNIVGFPNKNQAF